MSIATAPARPIDPFLGIVGDPPRDYQLELFEAAKRSNVIVAMETGSGKTLIAAMLIDHVLLSAHGGRETHGIGNGGGGNVPIAVMLVPTVALVEQQAACLRRTLPGLRIRHFHGGMNCDMWSADTWGRALADADVFVMTAQILLDLLGADLLAITKIALLVFDEAHHTRKRHPYNRIMAEHYHPARLGMAADADGEAAVADGAGSPPVLPRILGLTASPFAGGARDIDAELRGLEHRLDATIVMSPRYAAQQRLRLATLRRVAAEPAVAVGGGGGSDDVPMPVPIPIPNEAPSRCSQLLMPYDAAPAEPPASPLAALLAASDPMAWATDLSRGAAIAAELGAWFGDRFLELCVSERWLTAKREAADALTSPSKRLRVADTGASMRLAALVETIAAHPDYTVLSYGDAPAGASVFSASLDHWPPAPTPAELSHKVRCLQALITAHYASPTASGAASASTPMPAICFAQLRYTTYLLFLFVSVARRERVPGFDHVRPGIVLGHSAGKHHGPRMSIAAQKAQAAQFVRGRTNLLFATSVVEEGLDVAPCSLVIRFDAVLTLGSFIQSRGRARRLGSRFILFTPRSALGAPNVDTFHVWNRLETRMIAAVDALFSPEETTRDDSNGARPGPAIDQLLNAVPRGATVAPGRDLAAGSHVTGSAVASEDDSPWMSVYEAKNAVLAACRGASSLCFRTTVAPEPTDARLVYATLCLPPGAPLAGTCVRGPAMPSLSLARDMAFVDVFLLLRDHGLLVSSAGDASAVPSTAPEPALAPVPAPAGAHASASTSVFALSPGLVAAATPVTAEPSVEAAADDACPQFLAEDEDGRNDEMAWAADPDAGTPGDIVPAPAWLPEDRAPESAPTPGLGMMPTAGLPNVPVVMPYEPPPSLDVATAAAEPRRAPKSPPEPSVRSILRTHEVALRTPSAWMASWSPDRAAALSLCTFVSADADADADADPANAGTSTTPVAIVLVTPTPLPPGVVPMDGATSLVFGAKCALTTDHGVRIDPLGERRFSHDEIAALHAFTHLLLRLFRDPVNNDAYAVLMAPLHPDWRGGGSGSGSGRLPTAASAIDDRMLHATRDYEANRPGGFGFDPCRPARDSSLQSFLEQHHLLQQPLVHDAPALRDVAVLDADYYNRVYMNLRLTPWTAQDPLPRPPAPEDAKKATTTAAALTGPYTFKTFYQNRLGVPASDLDDASPVVVATPMRRLVQRMGVPAAERGDEAFLIAPRAVVLPIPSSMLDSALAMPLIVRSIQHFLLTHEFVAQHHLPPAPLLIQEALTTPNAQLPYDYQRLEFLGDAVLKIHQTLHLFSLSADFSEGWMTRHRSDLESNVALYRNAIRTDLPTYILAASVDARRVMFPRQRDTIECTKTRVAVSGKQLADIVEALIGAVFIGGGVRAAMALMASLLVDMNSQPWEDYHGAVLAGYAAVHAALPPVDADLAWYATWESGLRRLIGRPMTHPALFRDATTHGSAGGIDGTGGAVGCYERLEFLGDAVLGICVSARLFKAYPMKNAHQLSSMRSKIVCNQFLAVLCVSIGLHRLTRLRSESVVRAVALFETQLAAAAAAAKAAAVANDARDDGSCPLYWTRLPSAPSILGDLVEALLGAYFLDVGCDLDAADALLTQLLAPWWPRFHAWQARPHAGSGEDTVVTSPPTQAPAATWESTAPTASTASATSVASATFAARMVPSVSTETSWSSPMAGPTPPATVAARWGIDRGPVTATSVADVTRQASGASDPASVLSRHFARCRALRFVNLATQAPFRCEVRCHERVLGTGTGPSRKMARQIAAQEALLLLPRDTPLCLCAM